MNRMTSEEAIEILDFLSIDYYPNASEREALAKAIKAVEKIEKIQEIINIDDLVFQKYKMICEVIANDTYS